MKVTVTEEDLASGLTRSYTHDAVCKAIRRAVNKKFKLTHNYQILIPCQDYVFIDKALVELPEQAMRLIKQLDNSPKEARPISFELPDPPEDFFTETHPPINGHD